MTCGTRDRRLSGEADGSLCKQSHHFSRLLSLASDRGGRIPDMCGIAGYSLNPDSPVERTLAAQALLAGIAERGADAVGYAARGPEGAVDVTKLRGGASALLDEIEMSPSTTHALIHVRDYTKGHPEIEANNHPIRHGAVVGVHNGVILNDDALLARYEIERFEADMTVDSEAIF